MVNQEMRTAIILAANRVLAAKGLSGTTVEAVAAEAGVSKGGLLYYFPSKKELMLSLLEMFEVNFYQRRDSTIAALPDSPARMLKATVLVLLENIESTVDGIPNLATVLDDPVMRKRVGDFKRKIFEEVSAPLSVPEKALIAMYVVDGIWMDVRFDPEIVSKERRRSTMEKLVALIDEIGQDSI